ncbi:hypothetical protein E8E11_006578 [Didymella keratinophila]|nr:hypothetical protein E8E11_006578 [Didymella keratinophila]
MAPNIQRSERTTRSSTRSQTQKSRDDNSSTKPLKVKGTGKIDKKPKKATKNEKAKKAKEAVESKKEPDTNNERTSSAKDKHDSTSPSTSATSFTIDSDLVNKPIVCHQYAPSTSKPQPNAATPFIFTHGAGGTISAPAVVNFCTGFSSISSTPLLAFQGSSNLGARVRGFHACRAHLGSEEKDVVFGGRSMGARAAVMAATELVAEGEGKLAGRVRLMLVSYPLQGPKDVRDQILLDLPKEMEVLFIIGDRDAMCPLELLGEVRRKMEAKSRLVVVRGADHGMNVRPTSMTQELGEETGVAAARWMSSDIESEGETLFIGNED